jgi:hypothetical protein
MTEILGSIDKLFLAIPAGSRSAVAFVVLLLLVWSIFRLLRGSAIYIVLILILLPGVWPSLKIIGNDLLRIFGYLIYRI